MHILYTNKTNTNAQLLKIYIDLFSYFLTALTAITPQLQQRLNTNSQLQLIEGQCYTNSSICLIIIGNLATKALTSATSKLFTAIEMATT